MQRKPVKERRGQRDMSLPLHEWRFETGSPDHGARLDSFLRQRLDWRSRGRIRQAIEEGRVTVLPHRDPQQAAVGRVRPGLRLRRGQEIVVELPAPHAEQGAGTRSWEPNSIPVILADDHILAVNKPPHLNVYPTRRHRAGSLIELVHERQRLEEGGHPYPPTLCHRLDRETSGLVLFAKSRSARAELSRQFEKQEVRKAYLALVEGEVEEEKGIIEVPLGRDLRSRVEIKKGSREDGGGRPAVTEWRVRRRLLRRTLLELRPRTGRQHQLRAHLAAIGHPIVGDKLYLGGDDLFLRSLEGELTPEDYASLGHERQALHAWRLGLHHPATGEAVTLEAPLWPDIAEQLSRRIGPGGYRL